MDRPSQQLSQTFCKKTSMQISMNLQNQPNSLGAIRSFMCDNLYSLAQQHCYFFKLQSSNLPPCAVSIIQSNAISACTTMSGSCILQPHVNGSQTVDEILQPTSSHPHPTLQTILVLVSLLKQYTNSSLKCNGTKDDPQQSNSLSSNKLNNNRQIKKQHKMPATLTTRCNKKAQ